MRVRSRTRRLAAVMVAGVVGVTSARAVVVRGVVTDGQGRAIPNARVQLIFGKSTASYTVTRGDGSFEIRDGDAGRFVLLTSAVRFAPNISEDFYGGKTDIVTRPVVLSPTEIRTSVSVTASVLATPLPQLTAPVELISRDALATRVGVVDEVRLAPGCLPCSRGRRAAWRVCLCAAADRTRRKCWLTECRRRMWVGRLTSGR